MNDTSDTDTDTDTDHWHSNETMILYTEYCILNTDIVYCLLLLPPRHMWNRKYSIEFVFAWCRFVSLFYFFQGVQILHWPGLCYHKAWPRQSFQAFGFGSVMNCFIIISCSAALSLLVCSGTRHPARMAWSDIVRNEINLRHMILWFYWLYDKLYEFYGVMLSTDADAVPTKERVNIYWELKMFVFPFHGVWNIFVTQCVCGDSIVCWRMHEI